MAAQGKALRQLGQGVSDAAGPAALWGVMAHQRESPRIADLGGGEPMLLMASRWRCSGARESTLFQRAEAGCS